MENAWMGYYSTPWEGIGKAWKETWKVSKEISKETWKASKEGWKISKEGEGDRGRLWREAGGKFPLSPEHGLRYNGQGTPKNFTGVIVDN